MAKLIHTPRVLGSGLALLLALGSAASAEPLAAGKVVAVRGVVTATAPGGAPRTLACDDPIYTGDHLQSAERGKLGVMSNGVYSGMNEKTSLRFDATETGEPNLDLERGHLRVVEGGPSAARITTPGLLAYDAGSDTEALVFPEKGGVVSMVCPREESVAVTSPSTGGAGSRPAPGECAIQKPKEPLYTADASHPLLPLIDDACSAIPVAGAVVPRFGDPPEVSLGPVSAGPTVGPPIASAVDINSIRTGCDAGCTRSAATVPGPRASPFPNRGPP